MQLMNRPTAIEFIAKVMEGTEVSLDATEIEFAIIRRREMLDEVVPIGFGCGENPGGPRRRLIIETMDILCEDGLIEETPHGWRYLNVLEQIARKV